MLISLVHYGIVIRDFSNACTIKTIKLYLNLLAMICLFRYMFNTCRIPRKKKDEIVNHFKTVSEGPTPSHVIVLHKGHIHKLDLISSMSGKQLW